MKKLTKRMLALLLSLMMAFALAACGSSGSSGANEDTQAAEETSAADDSSTDTADDGEGVTYYIDEDGAKRTIYPYTYTTYDYDYNEVEVTIESCPETVYAAYQSNIEELIALGLADKIIGANGLDAEINEAYADEFAKITYYDSLPSKEDMIALDPDIICAWSSSFSDSRLTDVDFWHERGTATYMSLNSGARLDPDSVEAEMQDILTLGIIFDVQDAAEAIVAEMQAEIDAIADYIEETGIEKYSVAVLEDEGGTYRVYGCDDLGGCVALAGGAELAIGGESGYGNVSAEDLIAADPYAIYMVWYDGYTVNDVDYAGEQVVELITEDPAFASLQAVQNDRVYAINLIYTYCSGMNTVEGIRVFSESLYPEIYE